MANSTTAETMKRIGQIAVALLVLALVSYCQPRSSTTTQASSLPELGARIDNTSVSGISSGAYMAGQFQMAHAKLVVGAAIIAGGPYGCSESVFADTIPGPGTAFLNLTKAVNGCMLNMLAVWGAGDPVTLSEKAKKRADNGDIDPISAVLTDRIYLFSGTSDHTVVPAVVEEAKDFYTALGVPQSNIKFISDLPAGHAFVTEDKGEACEVSGAPYVVHCGYDQAGDLLQHIYGHLQPRVERLTGEYVKFSQEPFLNSQSTGLAKEGVAYVPQACRSDRGCSVHIAFHGCAQNRQAVGDAFIVSSGFARWADNNHLIVLFPQVETTALNPQGCWDWWGYTGHDYLTRTAPQIVAVRRMLETLGRVPAS